MSIWVKESKAYRTGLSDGIREGTCEGLLAVAESRLGPPDESVRQSLREIEIRNAILALAQKRFFDFDRVVPDAERDLVCIDDLELLRRIHVKMLVATSWTDAIAEPSARAVERRSCCEVLRWGLMCVGTEKFGEPEFGVRMQLLQMRDERELAILARRIATAKGWEDLLPGHGEFAGKTAG